MSKSPITVLVLLLAGAADSAASGRSDAANAVPQDGSRLYSENCAVCHGSTGRGDGPMAAGLTTPPPNLRRLAAAHGGLFPTAHVRSRIDGRDLPLLHGTGDMPVWGAAFKRSGPQGERRVQERLDLLIDFLQTLQEN